MSPLRLTGSTSGYSQIDAPAVAGDQTFTLPGTGGTLVTSANAGKILQVVSATTSTQTTSSSSTYADTGLAASITPTSATSKILVLISQNGIAKSNGDAGSSVSIKVFRGATEIGFSAAIGYTGTAINNYPGSFSFTGLDNPNTTSSVTYKTQFMNVANTGTVYVQASSSTSTITLMEVAA